MGMKNENCIMPLVVDCYLCPYSDLVFPNYPDTNDFDFVCSLDHENNEGVSDNEMHV